MRLLLVLCLLFAALLLFRSSDEASELPWQFDEPFYVTAARNLARDHRYVVRLFGREHPPRYPPAFSIAMAPLYWLRPRDLGAGVYVVFAAALAAVALAFRIGSRLGGPFAAVGASLALLWLWDFRRMSGCIMSDVPSVCALLACAVVSMELGPRDSLPRCLFGGLVFAGAAAVRALNIAVVGPPMLIAWRLWWERQLSGARAFALLGPVFAVLAAGAVYNARTFGAPIRNAYQYWGPFPHEVRMSVGTEWFVRNLGWLLVYGFPAVAALGLVGLVLLRLLDAGEPGARDRFVMFTAMVPGLHSALFMFYAWADMRLHLGLLAFLAVAGGAGVGAAIGRVVGGRLGVAGVALACAVACAAHARYHRTPAPPARQLHLERLRAVVPGDALLVITSHPLLVDAFVLEGTRRIAVPLDRRVELMDRPIAPRPLRPTPALSWGDLPGAYGAVVEAGAEWLAPDTAAGRPALVEEALAKGTPVVLEAPERSPDDPSLAVLRQRFRFTEVGPGVFRLALPR